MESDSKCELCEENFNLLTKVSRLMFCQRALHWLCQDCLENLIANTPPEAELYKNCEMQNNQFSFVCTSSKTHITCPFCLTVSHLPSDGIPGMPSAGHLQLKAIMESEDILAMTLMFFLDEAAVKIREIMRDLDEHQNACKKAKLAGYIKGIGGGITTAVGVCLVPFTLGASVALVIGGASVCAMGSLVVGGTLATEVYILMQKRHAAQELLNQLHHLQRIRSENTDKKMKSGAQIKLEQTAEQVQLALEKLENCVDMCNCLMNKSDKDKCN